MQNHPATAVLSPLDLSPYPEVLATMAPHYWSCAAFLAAFIVRAWGQASSCSETLTPARSIQPTVASGYRMALVATGLTKPRSIQFDSAGNLLVVQSGAGIANLAFQDDGGTCLSVKTEKTVIDASEVGILLFRSIISC